jgi:tRNA threonylcarbamoyl adenosine modification protein YeaZ
VILAVETSSAAASAAVVATDGAALGESRPSAEAQQARRLLECVHEALTMAGAALADIETVVCGLGPGTFTGLRIGIATARALAQGAGLPVAGVPSLEALACGLAAGEAAASATHVVPLIDGRRGEVFAAVYRRTARPAAAPGGPTAEPTPGTAASLAAAPTTRLASWPELELLVPLTVVSVDELSAFLSRFPGAVVGGDGALPHVDRLPPAVVLERAVAGPSALMVARTFLAGSPALTRGFADTLPIYGREPDAVPRKQALALPRAAGAAPRAAATPSSTDRGAPPPTKEPRR